MLPLQEIITFYDAKNILYILPTDISIPIYIREKAEWITLGELYEKQDKNFIAETFEGNKISISILDKKKVDHLLGSPIQDGIICGNFLLRKLQKS